jgi:hypothetical protein
MAYHPAPARLFSSIDRQVTLAFIAASPTPQAAAAVGEQRMAGSLARNRYTGPVQPEVLVKRLPPTIGTYDTAMRLRLLTRAGWEYRPGARHSPPYSPPCRSDR